MRKRRLFSFVSFDETEDALRAESLLGERGIGGRLVPTPPEVTASCGLAWRGEIGDEEAVMDALLSERVSYSGVRRLEAFE